MSDLNILKALQNIRNPWLDRLMVLVTRLGNLAFIYWIISFVFLAIEPEISYFIWKFLLISFVVCDLVIKHLVNRKRPFYYEPKVALLIKKPRDSSFPSGHTYKAFGVAFIFFGFQYYILATFLLVFACLMGLSRMLLFVHYLSDVLAGFLLSILTVVLMFYLL